MVEMKRYMVAVIAVLAGISGASAQQRTIIAGLEDNAEYRVLIADEAALVHTADSLAAEITSLRRALRTDTLARAAGSAAIAGLEERVFDIRSRMARIASQINTIEQEWILATLAGGPPTPTESPQDDDAAEYHPANLVYDSWFVQGLAPEQSAELHAAQRAESEVPRLVAEYRAGHDRLAALAADYDRAVTQADADTIRWEFDRLRRGLSDLENRVAGTWEQIFDSKSYLYNLLADLRNRRGLLALFEDGLVRLREQQPLERETGAPAPLADYVLQKRMLTEYEMALAAEIGNGAAADSLRRVAAALPGPESLAGLEDIALRQRLFLDYSDITVGGSPYSASNPIPTVEIWPRGVIWRVLVGGFSSSQSPSIFRGAHPMAVLRGDDGRFRYFAGGFPTEQRADAAVEQLRRAGFRAPSAVVWMDGVYIDPAAGEDKIYRVEIAGEAELSPALRDIIAEATGGGMDVVRGGEMFIVAPIDAAVAVRLRSALETYRIARPEVEVKLSKNPR